MSKHSERNILLGKKLRGIFLTGLAVTVPLGLTIYILSLIVKAMDSLLTFIPRSYQPEALLGMRIPGLGIMITLIIVFVCGLVTQSYIGGKMVNMGESLLHKIPVVRGIYNAFKQIFDTLFISKNQNFKKVVLVEFPRKGLYSVGFMTGTTDSEHSKKLCEKNCRVFVPTTPNPTTGFLIMVNDDELIELDITVEAAFTLIISGGIVAPPNQ